MKKILLLTIPLLIPALILTSCFAATENIDKESSGKTIEINEGISLVITLESNPTTGYNWVISEYSSTPGLELISQDYKQSIRDRKLVGAGGVQVFTFKAENKSNNTIILNYEREWEEEPVEAFEVEIIVK
ncbi:MAG: protease inhibitor I42 family protein [Actinomycetota bacterium]